MCSGRTQNLGHTPSPAMAAESVGTRLQTRQRRCSLGTHQVISRMGAGYSQHGLLITQSHMVAAVERVNSRHDAITEG